MQKSQPKVLEPDSFRAFFKARWAIFLKENYRSSEHVAVCFGVRHQTALNWLNAANEPHGSNVALAYELHPESAAKHLRTDGSPG